MAGDLTVAKLHANTINEDTQSDLTIHGMVINDANTVLLTDANSVLPVNIAISTRYVLVNPFGINVPVEVVAEILISGTWSDARWLYTTGGYGTRANYVDGVGVVVQTGGTAIATSSVNTGGGHGYTGNVTSTPCRVRVTRIGGQ